MTPTPPERQATREVTADLLARHDRASPRYTSYPTAVEFDEQVNGAVAVAHLAAADELSDAPLSIYVHLPFCQTRCTFCGCHVIAAPDPDRAARPYLELLGEETALLARHLPHRRQVAQLHLGGGTPTYYSPEELTTLVSGLLESFRPTPEAEMALEVDPRVTTEEHIAALAALGFNRISLGVQDFAAEVQEAIGRPQSLAETSRVIEWARARGFRGINIDLIYGLPRQEPRGFEATMDSVIQLRPDRLAVYSFAYVPWVRGHQRRIPADWLPDREAKFELLALARERLLGAGYEPIGMDHFALPEDELALARRAGRLRRNFQGYTVVPADDVLALGISAIADVRGGLFQNAKKLSRYREALAAGRLPVEKGIVRSADDRIRADVIAALMCNGSVDIPQVEADHSISFREYFARDLEDLRAAATEGLVVVEDHRIQATETGELLIRNLAMCFDRYFREKHAGSTAPVFSRTV